MSKFFLVILFILILYGLSYGAWRYERASILVNKIVYVKQSFSMSSRIIAKPVSRIEFILYYPCLYIEIILVNHSDSSLLTNGLSTEGMIDRNY